MRIKQAAEVSEARFCKSQSDVTQASCCARIELWLAIDAPSRVSCNERLRE